LLIALKCVQRLGYFPLLPDVPMAVQTFLCDALHLPSSMLPITEVERTRYRHREVVRSFLGLKPYTHHGEPIVAAAVMQAAESMSETVEVLVEDKQKPGALYLCI
jgi:hypothetical protein